MRKLLSPAFHKYDILEDFLQIMNEQADILTQILTEFSKKGQVINIHAKIGLCSLDIICGIYKSKFFTF